jgi:nucleoside-diphosphate-sugar epimerase
MKKKYLVLGATGSMGFAFTNELLRRGIETDILVRNRDKAEKLFQRNPLLRMHVGEVADRELLMRISGDKDVIFHGINYPYQHWEKFMEPVTAMIIEAAARNAATILFPGNIYAYGDIKEPIREETISNPGTKKGKIREELRPCSGMLHHRTNAGSSISGCRISGDPTSPMA